MLTPAEYTIRGARKGWNQFSLFSLLLGLTIATFVVGIATVGTNGSLLAIVLEVVAILVCIELLMRNLPRAIRHSVSQNAIRIDGSFSKRREQIEKRALAKFRWNLVTVFALVFSPTTVLLFGIHAFVFPLPLGFEAVSTFRLSNEEWKQEIREGGFEDRYEKWQASSGQTTASDKTSLKRMTWEGGPLIAVVLFAAIGVSFWALQSVYMVALKSLVREIQSRAQRYDECDLEGVRRIGQLETAERTQSPI